MSTPTVLLHPLGADSSFWTPVMPLLDRAVAVDLPGHGSEPALPVGAGIADLGSAVLRRLDAIGGGRLNVVGMSLGGLVAQWIAAEHPERVDRVVVADAVPVYPAGMQQMWRDRATSVRASGTAHVVDPTLELWFSRAFLDQDGPEVRRARTRLGATDPEGYARACDVLASVDTGDLLPRMVRPTLVVCGLDDADPFRAAVDRFASDVPDVRSVWLPGRHAAVIESSMAFADAVHTFLSGTEPDGGIDTKGSLP